MATFAKTSFGHASYAAFRPSYPAHLYDSILSFHRGSKKLCLDLGCGTGIASYPLSKRFDRVIGTDPSAGMVRQAQQKLSAEDAPKNIEFRQASAEDCSFIKDGEVDCVTAAQAAHWFDFPKWWKEMRRIVRPGGTIAVWGYKDHVFVDFPRASKTMQHYAYDCHPDMLGSHWPMPGRRYVQEKLRVIQPPEADWDDVRRLEYEPGIQGRKSGAGELLMERRVTVGEAKEYVRTWSSYHGWEETHPGQEARSKGGRGDIMDQMFDEIAAEDEIFRDEANEVDIEWGSGIVMARRK